MKSYLQSMCAAVFCATAVLSVLAFTSSVAYAKDDLSGLRMGMTAQQVFAVNSTCHSGSVHHSRSTAPYSTDHDYDAPAIVCDNMIVSLGDTQRVWLIAYAFCSSHNDDQLQDEISAQYGARGWTNYSYRSGPSLDLLQHIGEDATSLELDWASEQNHLIPGGLTPSIACPRDGDRPRALVMSNFGFQAPAAAARARREHPPEPAPHF